MPQDILQASPLQPTQDDLTLVDILLFVRRRWLVIFAPALIAAVAAAVVAATRTPVYQSTATLSVPSDTRPEASRVLFTPQAYQFLLESPTTKKELARRLEAKGVVTANATYTLRTRLSATTPPTMLEATAEAYVLDLPVAIVEEWVELFQERIQQTVTEAATEEDQSKKAKVKLHTQRIAKLQDRAREIEGDFAKKLADTVQAFEKMCIEHRQQTEDLLLAEDSATTDAVTAYETESEKLLRKPDFANSLAAMKIRMDVLRSTYGVLLEEQAKVTFQFPQSEGTLTRLQQLAQALDGCGEKLQALTLKLQEEQGRSDFLERARAAGLRKLKDERVARKAKLRDLSDTQLAGLEHQRDALIATLSQSTKERLASVYAKLFANQTTIDELSLAYSDPWQGPKVLVPAVAPQQSQPLGISRYMLLGLFGGLLLGLALAVVLEASARAFPRNNATTSPTPP